MYQGTGLDLPLMEWLDNYAYRAEESLDQNPHLAETNLILAQEMQTAGVRAFVGKLSMDNVEESCKSVEEFIHRCRASTAGFDPHQRLICAHELLAKLGELSQRESTRIQSHLAESFAEAKWVRDDHQIEDIEVFKKVLSPSCRWPILIRRNTSTTLRGTIQAHCTFLTSEELDELIVNQTAVAHCPLEAGLAFPWREALDKGMLVGLGTDIAGGYSIDILSSMRHAVATSRMREGTRALESQSGVATGGEGKSLAVEWKESLFLATHGVSVVDWERQAGIGALDFLIWTPSAMGSRWICDARNRVAMWVQGRQL
ncbi:hypothetical protein EV363DRAFT_1394569 [Boletus edulis]|nr:hypothetical protein EV363DRAFT_1401926 [Boletus edulis]KAF8136987.1 hypothetical protein EV363DRAFT_1394569 [Boletus edulis]